MNSGNFVFYAHRSRLVHMVKFLCLSCSLLLFIASCSGKARLAGPQPQPAPTLQEKTADTDCAYFYFLWGRWAENAGRPEEAREAYEKSLACDGNAVHVMRKLAALLARMHRKDEAVVWLEKIRKQRSADTEALTFVANLYAAMEMPTKATEIYQQILKKEPENLKAMLLLGTLYAQNRQYAKAREMLERLVRTDRNSYLGYYYLAKLYRQLHQFDKAIASYQQALDLNWSADLASEMVDLYENLNRYPQAIALYRKILTRDPTDEQARSGLIGVYLQQGDLDRAMAELKELRKYASDVQKVDFTIGRLLIEQKRYPQAIAKFSQMLAENPDLYEARYLLALTYYEQGNRGKAAELLRQIPAAAQPYEEATLLQARILEEKKDSAGVEALLKERLGREDTRRPIFYTALAVFYQEHDQPERGREVFTEALAHFPDDPQILFQYGLFQERTGHSEEAMSLMQKVLTIEPQNPYALNYVGYTWADQGVNLEQALSYIEQAVALKPGDGSIRDSLGWVYYRLGKIDRARAELEKARDLEPEDPHILEHLGDVYLDSDEPQLAKQAYKRAFELYEEGKEKQAVGRKLEAIRP
ncbi:MAG: tetratricopeptide repeat protein [Deltaproteobacteria bacterium]|jgi:tetratricopeptide (TPR) repeat protein